MIKEKDIIAEDGDYWVLSSKADRCYYVMHIGITHSVSDSAYALDDDGLSLAMARMQYLSKRHEGGK